MSISMTVKGLDKAIKTSSGMSDDLRHAYRIAMQTEVEKLADDTQQMVPVLTGFLKSTVYIEPPTQEDDISLGYGAYYAGIVNARVPYFTEEYERWRPTLAVRIKRLALELFIRGDPTFNLSLIHI